MPIVLRQTDQVIDQNGDPVVNGYFYVGTFGTDPIANPITIYGDPDLQVPVANPQRTDTRGRLVNDVYIPGTQYSYVIQNSLGTIIEGPKDRQSAASLSEDLTAHVDAPNPHPQYGREYNTVAAMKADTSIAAGETVRTNGYYAAGDGGGAQYTIAASGSPDEFGSHTLDNGTVANIVIDGAVNVRQFGAKGDGVADDTAAIQAGLDSEAGRLFFNSGIYRTTDSLLVDGGRDLYAEFNEVSGFPTQIKPDASVLVGVKVGSVSIFSGSIENIEVVRDSYSGATENVGWQFENCSGNHFKNLSGRFNKYNIKANPGDGKRVAYASFMNCGGVGGFYNLWVTQNGTGFANELTFYGGRMFSTSDTNTQIFQENNNHVRYVNISAEGTGDQSVKITGAGAHSNVIENVRTEGTWANDDVVIDAGVQNTTVLQNTLYTSITDNGNGTIYFTRSGSQFNGVLNTIPVLTIGTVSTGDGSLVQLRSNAFTASNKPFEVVRGSDGLNLAYVSGVGKTVSRLGFQSEQSGWNFQPLILGAYYLWVDATGDLRIKNGAPTSDTDGVVVGTQS